MYDSNNDDKRSPQQIRNAWQKEIIRAKKIIFIKKNEKEINKKEDKIELRFIENVDWYI